MSGYDGSVILAGVGATRGISVGAQLFVRESSADPRQSRSYGYSRQFIRRNEVIRQALL